MEATSRHSAMFPLGSVFLPGETVSLRVFESRYVAMCRDLLATEDDMTFCTVMITAGSEVGGNDRRGDVGTVVRIEQMYATDEGGYSIIGVATTRCLVTEWLPDNPYPQAMVLNQESVACDDEQAMKMCSRITTVAQRVRSLLQLFAEQRQFDLQPMPALTRVAAGQWWHEAVVRDQMEQAFWDVVRHVPCGAIDRYVLLQQDAWPARVQTLNRVIDHVAEVIAFQGFGSTEPE